VLSDRISRGEWRLLRRMLGAVTGLSIGLPGVCHHRGVEPDRDLRKCHGAIVFLEQ
jgi:hypothetical protein